jgi:hypothetical protein
MDLTPGRQRLLFVVVVVVLVGFGIFLIKSRHSGGTPAAAPSTPASTPTPGGTQASSVPPSSLPTATPVSTAGGAVIYQWLPFTQAQFSAATQTTLSFAQEYATWSYTESAAAYGAKLSPLVTPQELATLKNGYSTSGVAGPRAQDKQVSTGTAAIDSIRSIISSPTTSITFVVTIKQRVTSTQPTNAQSSQYAITLAPSGGTWQVTDLELSNLGNQ